jgi:hypothetical protein
VLTKVTNDNLATVVSSYLDSDQVSDESGDRLSVPIFVKPAFWKSEFDYKAEFFVELSSKKTQQTVKYKNYLQQENSMLFAIK